MPFKMKPRRQFLSEISWSGGEVFLPSMQVQSCFCMHLCIQVWDARSSLNLDGPIAAANAAG